MLKNIIIKERNAINELISLCDDRYEQVVSVLEQCNGKIVFMGVGKSGHIGKKLAATFASLGMPSFFVHSTEAMHGDLGMIQPSDIAVLISNSGNTQEVVQNVAPLKANGVTTIAFTARKDSKLSMLCDYSIVYPETKEADALNLAPTSSSTVALVLGDAIACELSERKKFTPEDFHKFHPNGSLGAYLSQKEKNNG